MREFTLCITGDIDTGEENLKTDLLPLVDLLASHRIQMTIPVTARAVEIHSDKIRLLREAGHEIAGHGDLHFQFRDPLEDQVKRIEAMCATFEKYLGFRPTGFRAPFLSHNHDTYRALSIVGLAYDSSRICRDPLICTKALLGRAYSYPFRRRSLPRLWVDGLWARASPTPFLASDGVVELPVLDLDDWFFYDAPFGPRLGREGADVISRHWLSAVKDFRMLGKDLMVLQAHPGNIHRGLLGAIDKFAQQVAAWPCTFRTLAETRDRYWRDPQWRLRNRRTPTWVQGV